MRDLFETIAADDPIAAARRGARPRLRRRFYDKAAAHHADGGFRITLDEKPARTPARRMLAAPTRALAQAIAAEWQAQRETDRSGNNAADAACQCDHRRRCRFAAAGRRRNRKISRVRSVVLPRRRPGPIARATGAALGPDPGLGARCARRAIQAGRRRRSYRPTAGGACGRACRDSQRSVAARRNACRDDADRLGAASRWRCCAARYPPTRRGRRPMSTRIGTWSNGAATRWRCSAARSAWRNLRPRRRC